MGGKELWVVAGGVLVILGEMFLFSRYGDPAFASMYGNALTATAAVVAVYAAILTLRFNHFNQLTPQRLEVYKKHIELIPQITQQIRRIRYKAMILEMSFSETELNLPQSFIETGLKDMQKKSISQFGRASEQLANFLQDWIVLLPIRINAAVLNLIRQCNALDELCDNKPTELTICDAVEKIDAAAKSVLVECADVVHVDEMTGTSLSILEEHKRRYHRKQVVEIPYLRNDEGTR